MTRPARRRVTGRTGRNLHDPPLDTLPKIERPALVRRTEVLRVAEGRATKRAKAPAKKTARKSSGGFTDEERGAMKERAAEARAERARKSKADGEKDVLAKIAEMAKGDRELAERVHEIVMAAAPDLMPRTWYGMPAYAKDGDVVCFFQNAGKFKARYSTLGFSDKANLDKGSMWPTSYALTQLTGTGEREIRALVKKAVS
jgi:uncharacterized protein YdhG (YjbR/CyaY superfamily)